MHALCTSTIAVALAGLLAACGGAATKTVTVTTSAAGTPTQTASTSHTSGTPATTAGTSTTPPATTSATTPRPTVVVHLHTFRSPTGNIGCVVFLGDARCDIRQRRWSPPARPAWCQLDYGQGLDVGSGGVGHLVCAGDTALDPTAPVLHYGTASVIGSDECVSAATGMTCTDTHTGHGFWIATQGYRTF